VTMTNVQNRDIAHPSVVVRLGSRCVSWYLRLSPIRKGKHAIWRIAAKRFLVSEVKPGLWIRASGLTDAEKKFFLRGTKEPRSIDFVAELLEPHMVALDVGANIGYYSLIFAGLVGEGGQVHAFEPTPALAERIRLNLALNGLTQIKVNQVAVADATGSASLHISLEDPEANSLFQMEMGTSEISVSTTTLDAYADDAALDRIDLIKIACEGSEQNVLRGAEKLLKRDDGPVLLLECNSASLAACGATVSDLCGYLRDTSYECYCLEQLREGSDPVWNLLALKGSHAKAHHLVQRFGLERFDSSYA
jgi:FkbM family methyltransferase